MVYDSYYFDVFPYGDLEGREYHRTKLKEWFLHKRKDIDTIVSIAYLNQGKSHSSVLPYSCQRKFSWFVTNVVLIHVRKHSQSFECVYALF